MAYTAPSVDASSQTFANLQANGFSGFLAGLVGAQSPAMSADATRLTEQLLHPNQAMFPAVRANQIVDSYLHGEPVSITSLKTEIFDLQYAFAAVATALGEIGVLVDANQGTLGFQPNQLTGHTVRTFA